MYTYTVTNHIYEKLAYHTISQKMTVCVKQSTLCVNRSSEDSCSLDSDIQHKKSKKCIF